MSDCAELARGPDTDDWSSRKSLSRGCGEAGGVIPMKGWRYVEE